MQMDFFNAAEVWLKQLLAEADGFKINRAVADGFIKKAEGRLWRLMAVMNTYLCFLTGNRLCAMLR